jgi:hypothetical protein
MKEPGFGDPSEIDDYRAFGPEPEGESLMDSAKNLTELCEEYLDEFQPGWRERKA